MTARHTPIGRPKHAGEQRGIDLVVRALPDNYEVYSNVDLASGRRAGHMYEHDLLILAPHAVFTVELKSWGGRITGNRDRWQLDDGATVQSPIPLVAEKARTLKSSLLARSRFLADVWVQGLVVVTGVDSVIFVSSDYDHLVATPKTVARALTDPAFWGLSGRTLTATERNHVLHVFADGEPVSVPTHIGQYHLLQRLASEGRPFDTWLGVAPFGERRVLHVYEVRGDNEKARKRSLEHALREATLHERLKGIPDLLDYRDYERVEHPPAVVLRFEDTTPLLPASTWVEEHKPGLEDRLRVAKRIAAALALIHARDIVHRRLSVRAILVSAAPSPALVRLSALELARDLTGRAATLNTSALEDPSYRCIAPELLRTGEATPASDLFSLGATLFELLNGRPLFERAEEALRPFEIPPLHAAGQPAPAEVSRLVRALLAPIPADRPQSAAEVERILAEVLAGPGAPAAVRRKEVLQPGDCISDLYQIVKHLGEGATGSVWSVVHTLDGSKLVAKVADAEHALVLKNESDVLQKVHHRNLVRYRGLDHYAGGNVLLLELAEGVDGRLWAGAGDQFSQEQLLRFGEGLFGALGALHDNGWLHRDVKPENVVIREPDANPILIDLGLARRMDEDGQAEGELTVGSVAYKDPLLWEQQAWTPANDLFAAWLVIYEVLTGLHAFDQRPEGGKSPSIDTSQFPDRFGRPLADQLGALFDEALSSPARRPRTAAIAAERLRALLAPSATVGVDPETLRRPRAQGLPLPLPLFQQTPPPSAPPAPPSRPAAPELTPESPITSLDLSVRGLSALERLGVTVLAQLAGIDDDTLRGMRNVGRKTQAEIQRLRDAIRARFPSVRPETPAPVVAPTLFYPPLIDDDRPLAELGAALTEGVRDALHARHVLTVGGLASMPVPAVRAIPGVGPTRIGALRDALRALAGDGHHPETLADLGLALAREIGADFPILAVHVGLHDGQPLSSAATAERLGFTRQRVSQTADLEPLRAGASMAAWLVSIVDSLLPRAGFAPIADVAAALPERLPPGEGASALGYTRLSALLMQPDLRVTAAEHVELVARAPWTPEAIDALRDALLARANWPPLPRAEAESLVWDAAGVERQGAMRRWGADPGLLLKALLVRCPDLRRTPDEALFMPPVSFAQALRAFRPKLRVGIGAEALLEALQSEYHAVSEPEDLRRALAGEGLALRNGVVAEATEEPERAPTAVVLDPQLPRQRLVPGGAIDVRSLVAALPLGGFRVAALPLGRHHVLCEQLKATLLDELAAAAGTSTRTPEDRVRFVDVDRVLIETLQDRGLWDDAVVEDGRPGARWGWARVDLVGGLEAAVLGRAGEGPAARPGVVTVLGRPSLLGPLALLDWLGGFYERARGGRYGLIVLALPGGVHDGRVRLNEQYGFAYTPDMAAICLTTEGDVAA